MLHKKKRWKIRCECAACSMRSNRESVRGVRAKLWARNGDVSNFTRVKGKRPENVLSYGWCVWCRPPNPDRAFLCALKSVRPDTSRSHACALPNVSARHTRKGNFLRAFSWFCSATPYWKIDSFGQGNGAKFAVDSLRFQCEHSSSFFRRHATPEGKKNKQ